MKIIEIILWLVGTACLIVYAAVQLDTAKAQSTAIESFETSPPEQSQWSASRIKHYAEAKMAGERTAIGILKVDAIDLTVAVFDGTDAKTLDIGIGRIPGTALLGEQGNLAIAGHRDGFFRGLKDIKANDKIKVQGKGFTDIYRVTEITIVEPEDVSVLEQTADQVLTLVTCYPFYFVGSAPQRFIVRAKHDGRESH